jgi:hypothetical protein
VSEFKYLGTTITNENLIQEEIKSRLNSGNACYHSVRNLLSSRLLSKNVKVRIYKSVILPVEQHRLWVFVNIVLARIFGPRRDEVAEGWRKLHNQEHQEQGSRGMHMGNPEGKRPLRKPRRASG